MRTPLWLVCVRAWFLSRSREHLLRPEAKQLSSLKKNPKEATLQ